MCGIAGSFAYHSAAPLVDRAELRAMRDHMRARGPDGAGEWHSEDGRLGLAHRRLAIIDLSERGAQPMRSVDGQLVITFNGEIYNYVALRKNLEARGHVFRGGSDTEVLLHLYADKGEAMLADLRGMFAFAIWDVRRQALFMARDPYGIKPLYYADDGWTLRFASQVKALLASPRVSRQPEPAGLAGFYLFGCVPEPYTLYQEIRALPAGSHLLVDRIGPREPMAYFSIADTWAAAEQSPMRRAEHLPEIVREAVLDSVCHHMVADVPVGAFLSAGIDSGALLGLMVDANNAGSDGPRTGAWHGTLRAITLAFDEFRGTHGDESPLAKVVASHYGVEHEVRVVSEDEFRTDLPEILEAMDQPSTDGINTWFVSKAAAEAGLKVAISGVGGDELFGGYPSFRDLPRWARLFWLPTRVPGLGLLAEQALSAFAPILGALNPKAAGLLRYGGRYEGGYLLRRGLFLPNELPALLREDIAHEGLRRLKPLAYIRQHLGTQHPHCAHSIVATLESCIYMRNQLLRDTDWASMAHSLEVRTPLVDTTLLRRIAPSLAGYAAGGFKQLLAGTPSRPLPSVVARRAKSGFTTPIAQWQQRGESTHAWKQVELLERESCPWARRWAHVVGGGFVESPGPASGSGS